MGARLVLTILGCGSSPGTPRITNDWGACDPSNPKNRRTRPAAMVERFASNGGVTRVVIDTGPDFRQQMLAAEVMRLDAVIYTHPHADHIHGIDDLRSFVLERKKRMPVYADAPTLRRLRHAFDYCFATPPGSSYPPILTAHEIDHAESVVIEGEGGALAFEPLPQIHGDIVSLGFRFDNIAYCPDVSEFPPTTVPRLRNLELLVLDALQYTTHPSHLSLDQALDWIRRIEPRQALLTHMHTPLDYETVRGQMPGHVAPAYDGMAIEFPLVDT